MAELKAHWQKGVRVSHGLLRAPCRLQFREGQAQYAALPCARRQIRRAFVKGAKCLMSCGGSPLSNELVHSNETYPKDRVRFCCGRASGHHDAVQLHGRLMCLGHRSSGSSASAAPGHGR